LPSFAAPPAGGAGSSTLRAPSISVPASSFGRQEVESGSSSQQDGQVVLPAPSLSANAHSATVALCALASLYIQNGASVPPSILDSISAYSPTTLPLDPVPIIQEPVTAPPPAGLAPSSAFVRDMPPHMNRDRPGARAGAGSGGGMDRRGGDLRSGLDSRPISVSSYSRSSFDFFTCFLDLSRSSPSTSNPFFSVITSLRKHVRPNISGVSILSRRGQWRDWDHVVRQVLTQWRLVGFILPTNYSSPPGTLPWLLPVPTPDLTGSEWRG
jgi:hypothetical protein